MELLSFRVHDYKAIVDSGECEVSQERITVLAGQNESGKTSILHALRDFDYFTSISSEALPDDKEDAVPTVDCTFSFVASDLDDLLDQNGHPYKLTDAAKRALLRIGKVTIRKSMPDNYSIIDDHVRAWLDLYPLPLVDDAPPAAAAPPSEDSAEPADDQTDESSEEAVAEATTIDPRNTNSELAIAFMQRTPYIVYFDSFDGVLPKRKYISDLEAKDSAGYQPVKDFLALAAIDVKRLTAGADPKQISNYLETKSATVTGDFRNFWSQKFDGKNQVEISTELSRDDKGLFLNFYVKDNRQRRYPEQRSKGFLWFLSFYLRLNAESRAKDEFGAVVLIDEPGSYLHPRAQKDILKVLQEHIAKERSQAIFSTHSSDLIDPEHINRVRLVLHRAGAGTKVHKITDPAAKKNGDTEFADALTPVIAAIGKDLGKDLTVVSSKNVLVEGISDFYYLTTLRDKQGFKIGSDIRIIPMTGAPSIHHMISIMIGWGLDYAVVMDRDDQSAAQYRKLVEELDVPSDKIFRIEGGKAIEDLFTDRDFKKYVLADEGAELPARKSKADFIGEQKVLLARNFREKYKSSPLRLEEATSANFSRITDFINKQFP